MTPADALFAEAAELRARAEAAEAEARRLQARERENAIVEALEIYEGPLTRRAAALARDLSRYLGTAWPRERWGRMVDGSPQRRALHRIAVSRNGEGIKARRIIDVAKKCNPACLRLHKSPDEASPESEIGEAQ